MFRSYRVGSLLGFPIEVNLSFLILLGVVLLMWGGLAGVFLVLIAFASVLLHELGHALMARHLGVNIAGIELHFFGGAAKMTSQPKTANDEVAIAAAGPAVSFALGGLGFMMASWTGAGFFQAVAVINTILGGFNLVPALPMDGGRILRALLTRKVSFVRATRISVMVARGFAALLVVYGLLTLQLYMLLLAGLLWFMGSAELRMAEMMDGDGYFAYDQNGYRFRGGYAAPWDMYGHGSGGEPRASHPFFSIHRPIRSSGFVIRQRNGRLYIDPLP